MLNKIKLSLYTLLLLFALGGSLYLFLANKTENNKKYGYESVIDEQNKEFKKKSCEYIIKLNPKTKSIFKSFQDKKIKEYLNSQGTSVIVDCMLKFTTGWELETQFHDFEEGKDTIQSFIQKVHRLDDNQYEKFEKLISKELLKFNDIQSISKFIDDNNIKSE